MNKIKAISFMLLLLLGSTLAAQQDIINKKPNPARFVNDFANILSESAAQSMEQKLAAFSRQTSNQIVVVTVQSLDGLAPGDFAQQLGEKWGVGSAKFDNGIVMLIKPKYSESDRGQIFIATGYGLEGAIPDATCARIIDSEIIPEFKEGDMVGGINAGLTVLMDLAKGEYSSGDYIAKKDKQQKFSVILFFILFVSIFVFSFFSKVRRTRSYASTNGLAFWAAWALLGSSSRSHGGSYSGFSSGGGSFGGGSFGGGGAGGSW